jgi:4-alpha-glucanotransferase
MAVDQLSMQAEALGVATSFEDATGRRHRVTEATLRAVLRGMGVDPETGPATPPETGDPPPTVVLRRGQDAAAARSQDRAGAPSQDPAAISSQDPAAAPSQDPAAASSQAAAAVRLLAAAGPAARVVLETGEERPLPASLPGDLPLGYHRVLAREADSLLVVAPPRCHLPAPLRAGGRAWGWAVQLYALRSRASWGMGDLGDLAGLCRFAASLGAGFALLNPVHAASPAQPSPYYPSSRVFRNPLYLRVEDVPEARRLPPAERARLGELADAGRRLTAAPRIDREAVARLKDEALRLCHGALVQDTERAARLRAYRAATPGLDRYATFCSLQHALGDDWRAWPARYRDPDGPAVGGWTDDHPTEVGYHAYLQWLLDEQLAAVPRMAVGLVNDLAVGVAPGGFDAWSFQRQLAQGITVGAPPDALGPLGQDWGFPPFVPASLAACGYAPFVDTIRAGLRHAGGLRVDHVMGLFRLFWIPEGRPPVEGTYVRYPVDDLLGILALESHRAGGLVVGEDLGTVEQGVRERLAAEDVLSYRLAWFEQRPDGTGRRRSADYPRLALAAATTHDLPTMAGFLTGADLAHQREIGVVAPAQADEAEKVRREEAESLLGLLEEEGLLDPGGDRSVGTVVAALYAFLARTPSMLVAATLEDAVEALDRPNVPGTQQQRPNWSLPLPVLLDDLPADPRVRRLAAALASVRSKP